MMSVFPHLLHHTVSYKEETHPTSQGAKEGTKGCAWKYQEHVGHSAGPWIGADYFNRDEHVSENTTLSVRPWQRNQINNSKRITFHWMCFREGSASRLIHPGLEGGLGIWKPLPCCALHLQTLPPACLLTPGSAGAVLTLVWRDATSLVGWQSLGFISRYHLVLEHSITFGYLSTLSVNQETVVHVVLLKMPWGREGCGPPSAGHGGTCPKLLWSPGESSGWACGGSGAGEISVPLWASSLWAHTCPGHWPW